MVVKESMHHTPKSFAALILREQTLVLKTAVNVDTCLKCDGTFKGEGKRFLHGDLICTYILSEYIFDIYVHGLCIISVKLNFETRRDFVRHYLFTVT